MPTFYSWWMDTDSRPNGGSSSSSGGGGSSNTGDNTKTRWQNIAEQLFCNLLQIKNFTPNHVSQLIDLRNKTLVKGDKELVEIIDNYLHTL